MLVWSLHSGSGSFTSKYRRRGEEFFAVAEVSQRARWRANHVLEATWLIGALFKFFHPHWGLLLGESAHEPLAAPWTDTTDWRFGSTHCSQDEEK
jgi:hypothetical protein